MPTPPNTPNLIRTQTKAGDNKDLQSARKCFLPDLSNILPNVIVL